MDADVVVVGAGPTGLAAGSFAHAHGARVVLLEREAATVVEPRAVTLDDESLRAVATLGLLGELEPLLLSGYGTRWYTGSGRELAQVSANATRYGYPCRNGFSQPEFVALLARHLSARADVRFETAVTAVEPTSEGVRVHARSSDGREQTLTARYAVACDGAASPIRESLGIPLAGASHAQPWLIVDTINSTESERYSKFYCGNPRPYVAVPGRDGRLRYEFMIMPGEDPEQLRNLATVRAWLAGRRELEERDVVRIAVYRFHSRIAERWRVGPILLAGDAAHLMPPFAGQGMNSGIRDAYNLGWKLALVARELAGDVLLDSYQPERAPHVRAMLQLSETIGAVVMARDSLPALARDVLLGGARHVPGLRRYLAEMRFKPKARFESRFVFRQPPGLRAAGRLAPNPIVIDAAGQRHRFDEVAGAGFALVALGANPVVPAPDSALFEALGARRVRLYSGERIPLPAPDAFSVADTEGVFARDLGLHGDAIVLVRPDRIVAGAFAPADLPRFEAAVRAALGVSPASGAPAEPPIAVASTSSAGRADFTSSAPLES